MEYHFNFAMGCETSHDYDNVFANCHELEIELSLLSQNENFVCNRKGGRVVNIII